MAVKDAEATCMESTESKRSNHGFAGTIEAQPDHRQILVFTYSDRSLEITSV
jgi:hypothetical protein